MGEAGVTKNPLAAKALTISRFRKERFLLSMSEDRFRDEVIRPLFLRQGLKDGRDVCGPFEKGKDAIFVSVDQLGMTDVYVVQTKKGHLNLAKKAKENIVEAATQLKTALATRVIFVTTKEKRVPTKVILCASGKVNDAAQQYILEDVGDPRIVFMDSDHLIPVIDETFPELWLGLDAEIAPYLRLVKKSIEESSESLPISDVLPAEGFLGAASDNVFVSLRLWRMALKRRKHKGEISQLPELEEMPVTGILTKKTRLVLILGGAGAGKSTAVRRLAYVLAEKEFQSQEDIRIPVLLRAVDISLRGPSSLVEFCAEETQRITQGSKPCFSTSDLLSGRLVIFVDALDELPEDAARRAVLELVNNFHKLYPSCQIIITSREYAFIKDLEGLENFETYRLSPLSFNQAAQIIDRVAKGRGLPAEISKETIRRLQQIHGMELNPLLVTVFAAISDYSRQDIPANVTELFKKFTEMMLGRWDTAKGLAQQYYAPLKDFILTKVAFEMHRREVTTISLEEFLSIVEAELLSRGHKAEMNQLLDEMLNRSGLFRITGESVEFRHLLLQEFFAGRGIPSIDFLETVVSADWWRRAIVFYFGQNPDNHRALFTASGSLASKPSDEIFRAAMTLGLSLQACYLVKVEEKVKLFRDVIVGLATGKEGFLKGTDMQERFPLTTFLFYYLFGRDSVALSILGDTVDEIGKMLAEEGLTQEEKDFRTFWLIVGLIESGSAEKAESLVRKFRPSDYKLLLAIHLGCLMMEKIRVATRAQKESASRISQSLSDKIEHLRKQLLKEFQSEFLEIRKGEIKAIEAPKP